MNAYEYPVRHEFVSLESYEYACVHILFSTYNSVLHIDTFLYYFYF